MRNCRQGCKGYSLMELVAAMIVVSVVMGVAIPNYTQMRLNADGAKAEMNLHSIYLAQKEYLYENPGLGYAVNGQIDDLRRYVDFALDDGTWEYSIQGANATTFTAEAWHLTLTAPLRIVQIDETGSITRLNF